MSVRPFGLTTRLTPPKRALLAGDERKKVGFEVTALLGMHIITGLALPTTYRTGDIYRQMTTSGSIEVETLLLAARVGLTAYFVAASGLPLRRFGLVRPRVVRDTIVFVMACAVCGAIWWVGPLIHRGHDAIEGVEGKPVPSLFLLCVAYWVVGFGEELLYRGYLITRLKQLFSSDFQVLILSSLIFGSVHAYQGLPGMAMTALFGLAFGFLFMRTRTLWPLAVAHAGEDLIGALIVFARSGMRF